MLHRFGVPPFRLKDLANLGTAASKDAGSAAGNVLQISGTTTLPITSVVDAQTFTSSNTWTKPSVGTVAFVQVWGPGGSGGSKTTGAGGGGGEGGG